MFQSVGDLTVAVGPVPSLSVEAEDNIQPYIHTSTQGGKLVIEVSNDGFPVILLPSRPIRYTLTVRSLRSVQSNGSGRVLYYGSPAVDAVLLGSGTIGRLGTQ